LIRAVCTFAWSEITMPSVDFTSAAWAETCCAAMAFCACNA
jgi:hypothetical protein